MSKSSAFSINTQSIFEIQETNGTLFLNAKGLLFPLALFAPLTVTIPLTTIYASLQYYKPNLSIDVLNLIRLLVLHVSPD